MTIATHNGMLVYKLQRETSACVDESIYNLFSHSCDSRNVRYPYRDMLGQNVAPLPRVFGSNVEPNLLWTREIEYEIAEWQATGNFPFKALQLCPTPQAQLYSVEELRLIYHVAGLYCKLAASGLTNYVVWVGYIPK